MANGIQRRRNAVKMPRVVLAAAGFLTILLAVPRCGLAQVLDGELRGVVLDPQGKAVSDVRVSATNENTNILTSTQTSAAGVYDFPDISVGAYTVRVEAPGFAPYTRSGIQVRAAEVAGVAVSLTVGSVTTQVQVASGADVIQTEDAQLGGSFEGSALTDIPVATGPNLSLLNLSILLPNTTTAQGGTAGDGGSVGGVRARQNSFSIDGVDNNDPDGTTVAQPVIPDAVKEFTVNQNVFSAEYGRGSGGQFNVITKTGTNQLHFGAWAYNGNRAYDAANNLEKAGLGKQRYDFNRVGGDVGGPILRDKLFLYGAYEFNDLGQPVIAAPAGVTPTAAGVADLSAMAVNPQVRNIVSQFPVAPVQNGTVLVNGQPVPVGTISSTAPSFVNDQQYIVNADWNLGRQNLQFRFVNDRNRQPSYGAIPQAQFASLAATDNHRLTINDVWTATPRLVNDFTASYSRFSQFFPLSGVAQNYPNIFISGLFGNNIAGPNAVLPQSRAYNEYLLSDVVSWNVGERHSLKFGGQYDWFTSPAILLPYQRGEYAYFTMSSLVDDAVPGEAFQGAGSGFFSENAPAFSLFVQDDIKITPRLMLNAGLRYDFFGNPAGAKLNALNAVSNLPGTPLIFGVPKNDLNNFGPRLGFAWDPTGTGKWAVRGGGGIVYDWIPWNFERDSLPPQVQALPELLNFPPYSFSTSSFCQGTFGTPPAWCTGNGTGFLAGGGMNINFVPPTTQASARAQTTQLMADSKDPKVFTWTLGVQHEIARNTSLELRYLGTRALELPVQLELNSVTPFDSGAQPLPTYIQASQIPSVVSSAAPNLAQFESMETLKYGAQGFIGGPLHIATPAGSSTYHAGSIELLHRFDRGLLLRANYTFSKTMDDATNELGTSYVNPERPQDSYNLRDEWARSALDVPHKVVIAFVYDTPRVNWGDRFTRGVLNGWEGSGSYVYESGQPVTIQSGVDSNGNGDFDGVFSSDRAILNPAGAEGVGSLVNPVCRDATTGATSVNPNCSAGETVGYVAINPDAKYIQAGVGAMANIGRNTYRTPAFDIWNLAILRNAKLSERATLQFRVEAYDAFNHRNFTMGTFSVFPSLTNALNPGYASLTGVPGGTFLNPHIFNGGSRQIQLVLRLGF